MSCAKGVHTQTTQREKETTRCPDVSCILHSFQCTLGFQTEAGQRPWPTQYTRNPLRWRVARFTLPDGFAQDRKTFRCEGDPARMVRGCLDRLQLARDTPVGNRADVDL